MNALSFQRVYVARQPILDRKGRTHAYELLYRENLENYFVPEDHKEDLASKRVLVHAFLHFGLENIAFGRKVFVNFTANLLRAGIPYLFSPQKLVIEILERISAPQELLPILRNLKKKGYAIALDDFRAHSPLVSLLPYADYVKIDFQATPPEEIEHLSQELEGDFWLVAEKVETQEELERARALGFKYFQGFFFARPKVLSTQEIPVVKAHYLRLIKFLYSAQDKLEEVIKVINSDPALALKLLKYINSAFFGFVSKINSIRHAAVLLGYQGLRKWASLVALHLMAADRPPELIINSMVRARFMELLAQRTGLGERSEDAFIVGLFSLLEAMLDQPMHTVLRDLPLDEEVKAALLGRPGPFTSLLEVIRAYESGQWETLKRLLPRLGLPTENSLPEIYAEALAFAHQAFTIGA